MTVLRGVLVGCVAVVAACSQPAADRGDASSLDGDARRDAGDRDASEASSDAELPDASPQDAAHEADGGVLDCPGLETWGWEGETFVSTAPGDGPNEFVPGEWAYDVAYAAGQVRADATYSREPGTASIRAFIDPSIPVPSGVDYEANFRSEIARRPWHEPVALGTELWIGFSYYFPATYVQDTSSRATIFQLHAGRHSPPIEIAHWVPADFSGAYGTELHVVRRWGGWNTDTFDRGNIPVSFEPDHWYDFVVHVVWDVDGGTRGLTEIWVNGTQYYSETGGNTYSAGTDDGDLALPYGGTPKLGWYKWPWHGLAEVAASSAVGVTELEMFIGAVRILRQPEGDHVGERGYDCVAPRGARP